MCVVVIKAVIYDVVSLFNTNTCQLFIWDLFLLFGLYIKKNCGNTLWNNTVFNVCSLMSEYI